jgi:hypothetical protein
LEREKEPVWAAIKEFSHQQCQAMMLRNAVFAKLEEEPRPAVDHGNRMKDYFGVDRRWQPAA